MRMNPEHGGGSGGGRGGQVGVAAALACLMLLALSIRSLGFEFVFVGDEVIFPPADAQYHLRRAFYTFANFPALLLWDPYVNFPDGAPVPWPPLFDIAIGGVAHLLATDVVGFERVAAWAGPACAVVALIPIYLSGRLLASPAAGLAAAGVYACLPIGVVYSRVGNPDHHAAVAMFGAWLLLACLGLAERGSPAGRVRRWGFVLGFAQLGLLLTWHGSLLYVVLANALLLGAGILGRSASVLLVQAGAAAASGLLLVPLLLASPEPLGGTFSSISFSWFPVLVTLAIASVSAVAGLAERRKPGGGVARPMLWGASAGLVWIACAALVPQLREALAPALGFLAQTDSVGTITGEQNPLFGNWDRLPAGRGELAWGGFVYTLPFMPVAAAWLGLSPGTRRSARPSAMLLAGWVFVFSVLALDQRRYGNDLAPAFAVLFGVFAYRCAAHLTHGMRASGLRASLRFVGVLVLAGALLWPAMASVYGPRARTSLEALKTGGEPGPGVTRSVAYTLAQFMAEVRAVTPETGGYSSPGPDPVYGVIAHPNLGHAIQYGARRPSSTNPFWWYIGPENWEKAFAFLEARSEGVALRWAEALRGRYVLTTADEDPRAVTGQLHAYDGRAMEGKPALAHFRLITESEPGGRGVGEIFRPRQGGGPAYKLFEIVPGARLVVEAPAGEEVTVSLALRARFGRPFRYRVVARADPSGKAIFNVPYATELPDLSKPLQRTRAQGPYAIEVAGDLDYVHVSEEAVTQGAQVFVGAQPR